MHDSLSASEETENINEDTKCNGRLKMFSGTGTYQAQTGVDKKNKSESYKHFNGDIIMKSFEEFSDVWKDPDEFHINAANIRSFQRDTHNKDNFRERTQSKNSNSNFEIVRNENIHEGLVKPYVSSESDSEGDSKNKSNMKVLHKGVKKFKRDTVNDISQMRANGFRNKSMLFRKEDKREERWRNRNEDSDNWDSENKKEGFNGYIEGNTAKEVDKNLKYKTKNINPISQISEERRQKSVLEKMKTVDEQKKLIKNALRQVVSHAFRMYYTSGICY